MVPAAKSTKPKICNILMSLPYPYPPNAPVSINYLHLFCRLIRVQLERGMGSVPTVGGSNAYPSSDDELQILAAEFSTQLNSLATHLSSLSLERVKSTEFLEQMASQIKQVAASSAKASSLR